MRISRSSRGRPPQTGSRTGSRSAIGTVAVDAKRPDLFEQACCCSAPVKAREVGEGRKDVIWVACPGRSVAESGVGAVLTQF